MEHLNKTTTVSVSTSSSTTCNSNMSNLTDTVMPLLYCAIGLLAIITILLLIILFKRSCKKCKRSLPDSTIEGGTFRMSDLRCNSALENPNADIVSHTNNLQTLTPCNDDSSSTSSESMCHSYEEKKSDNNQQYMSLKSTLQSANYENIPGEKSASGQDYKKRKPKKNRDYVNVEEQHNRPLTKGRKSKTERHQGDQDESQTSSESSSDESDDDSVNYTTVVFKEGTNVFQTGQ